MTNTPEHSSSEQPPSEQPPSEQPPSGEPQSFDQPASAEPSSFDQPLSNQPPSGQPQWQAPPAPPSYGATAAPLSVSDEKTLSLAAHLLCLIAGFVAPLVIWLVFKGRGPFLEHHAKEALNFQITVMVALLVGGITALLLVGVVLILVLIPWMVIMPIIAAVKASSGEWYRYPLTFRFVR